MKEITAIIRTNRIQKTRRALEEAGFPSMTAQEVLGRGRQRGLQHEFCHELPEPEYAADDDTVNQVGFIPKRMLTLVVDDADVDQVVALLIGANQTGNVGDGKIFVSAMSGAVRVRTGERGVHALV
ncbi:MAG: P-II family nitrogen regulator [Gaiellales bacterium]|nr:MAG: P-II family nitrogen regulator [Gaiellales bacterium]